MNIYDATLALPPAHRRTLAAWILRTVDTTDKQMLVACREARQIDRKRQSKENDNSMKVINQARREIEGEVLTTTTKASK